VEMWAKGQALAQNRPRASTGGKGTSGRADYDPPVQPVKAGELSRTETLFSYATEQMEKGAV
jgi:hypothetical protein